MISDTHWMGIEDEYLEYAGFVYKIINKQNNKAYIGKKNFYRRMKRALIESDWKKYQSSSVELKKDIKKHGKEGFEFYVLAHCKTRQELNELEVAMQFNANVLHARMEDGSFAYYNKNIMSKYYQPADPDTEEYKTKCKNISIAIKKLYASEGYVHPMKGKTHPNNGKKMPQTAPHNTPIGATWFTNGEINRVVKKGEVVPDGFSKGVTRRKPYINSFRQQQRFDFSQNPPKCEICKKPLSFAQRRNKTCGKKCQGKMQSETMQFNLELGVHPFSVINDPSTNEYKEAKEKQSSALKEGFKSGRLTHPMLGKSHPCKGKKRVPK
jgi:group I intron endonuclease